MNKTTEALRLAEEAIAEHVCHHGYNGYSINALAAIREALAEPVKQEPVAIDWDKIQEVLSDVWCRVISADDGLDAIQDLIYAAPVSAPKQEPKCNPHPDAPHGFARNASHNAGRYVCDCEFWEPEEPVQRPPNCGTGYCSCIECIMEPISIPNHVTCPFCESDHVPDWLHDLKLDAKAIRAEALEEAIKIVDNVLGRQNAVSAAIRGLK